MNLLTVLLTIIVVGFLLGIVNMFVLIDSKIKMILNAVVVIMLIVWLFKVFGLWGYLGNVHV